MATKDITTWDEFKTALREIVTEETTYTLKNDIDMSENLIESTINCIGAGTYNKIFEGDNHVISGITSYANINGVFSIADVTGTASNQHHFIFRNIKFYNYELSATQGSLIYVSTRPSTTTKTAQFINCSFSGNVNYINNDSTATYRSTNYFDNCIINLGFKSVGTSSRMLNNCWCSFNSLAPINFTTTYLFSFTSRNCYFEGKITCQDTGTGTKYLFIGNDNVFNIDLALPTTLSTVYASNVASTTTPDLINIDKITGKSIAVRAGEYQLTDSQIKNSDYIRNNTTFIISG